MDGNFAQPVRVAALQMNSQDDVSANLEQARQLVEQAAKAGASLIVLPEAFAFLGSEAEKKAIAESLEEPGPVLNALRSWAQRLQVELIAGGLAERAEAAPEQPPYNSSVHVAVDGSVRSVYRKMHLFDVNLSDGTSWFESRGTTAGSTPQLTQHQQWQIGMSICYDLRFPELYSFYRAAGAHILTVPAAFTKTTGQAHWHLLLRARAIETQCFVIAAAQQGDHPRGRQTFGHAMIIDPWGEIIAEREQAGPGLVLAELDAGRLISVREQMPLAAHRRDIASGKWH